MMFLAVMALALGALPATADAGIEAATARSYAAQLSGYFGHSKPANLNEIWSAVRANPGNANLAPIRDSLLAATREIIGSGEIPRALAKAHEGDRVASLAMAKRLHTIMLFAPLISDTGYPDAIRANYSVLRAAMSDRAVDDLNTALSRITQEVTGDDVVIGLNTPRIATTNQLEPSGRKKPVILISADIIEADTPRPFIGIRHQYIQAIEKAGALPLLAIPTEDPGILRWYIDQADAFLFVGGADYDPMIYGQNQDPSVHPQPIERTRQDVALMRRALQESFKPILAVCAGHQLMNIVLGGTLVQDLPPQAGHRPKDWSTARHSAAIAPDTLLAQLFNALSINVNSIHHQATDAKTLPPTLTASATAPDGTIEALELADNPQKRFVLGVQWHPELMDEEHRSSIFGAFIAAAKRLLGLDA